MSCAGGKVGTLPSVEDDSGSTSALWRYLVRLTGRRLRSGDEHQRTVAVGANRDVPDRGGGARVWSERDRQSVECVVTVRRRVAGFSGLDAAHRVGNPEPLLILALADVPRVERSRHGSGGAAPRRSVLTIAGQGRAGAWLTVALIEEADDQYTVTGARYLDEYEITKPRSLPLPESTVT